MGGGSLLMSVIKQKACHLRVSQKAIFTFIIFKDAYVKKYFELFGMLLARPKS